MAFELLQWLLIGLIVVVLILNNMALWKLSDQVQAAARMVWGIPDKDETNGP